MKKDKTMIQFKEDGPFAVPQSGDGSGYAIVGVGSAGVNVVDHLVLENSGLKNVFAFDADDQKIRGSVVPQKYLLGRNRLRGLGTGGDCDLGDELGQLESTEFLRQVAGVRTVILVAGLGGGTGTGVLPVWVRELRDRGIRTLVLASMPFEFEGRRRRDLAFGVLAELQQDADVLLTFSNSRLLHLPDSQEDIREIYRHMNALLSRAAVGLQRMVEEHGSSPVPIAELQERVGTGGMENCWVGAGSASGPDRIERAIDQIMASPLLDDGSVWKHAESALMSVVAGSDFTMAEYQEIVKRLQDALPVNLDLRGSVVAEGRAQEKLQVTVLFTAGSGVEIFQADAAAAKAVSALADVPELLVEEPILAKTEKREEEAPAFHLESADTDNATPQRYFAMQEELPLDRRRQRGLFENTEPTLVDGEDLDIPTFIRLNMKIKV
jgi:cell division protein FtsZ